MKISQSTALKDTVKEGVINNQITIQLAGRYDITSIITKTSSDHLGLKVDTHNIVVIKTTNVVIAVYRERADLPPSDLFCLGGIKGQTYHLEPEWRFPGILCAIPHTNQGGYHGALRKSESPGFP